MRGKKKQAGFTLVELLVVIGILAILVAILLPSASMAIKHANCAGCASRMRMLGVAFTTFASDNDGQFPSRVTSSGNDKWPVLLLPYCGGNAKNFVDPGDPIANAMPVADLISNSGNNSSFFFNGFNDLGAYNDETVTVRLSNLTDLTNLILLGQKINGNTQYYMDFVEHNEDQVLNKAAYFNGGNYTFADGSSRFISLNEYNANNDDQLWLVNKSYQIPK